MKHSIYRIVLITKKNYQSMTGVENIIMHTYLVLYAYCMHTCVQVTRA